MNKEKFHIEMPDDLEIEAQIKTIINKGIKPKESFYSHIKNMYRQIGFKHLFHDIGEISFLIILILPILISLTVDISKNPNMEYEVIYSLIFMISPILYLIMSLFSFVSTKQKGTYEIEMVCKYNIYQLAALRMLIFSIICIIANGIYIYGIFLGYGQINFLKGFMISVTALFLFSTVFLYLITKIGSGFTKYFVIGGWIFINLALSIFNINFYNKLLMNIPTYVYLIVIIACGCSYIKSLKKLITFRTVKGVF